MKVSKIEGAQNVEVSKKIACEKPLIKQLEIMEEYTKTHLQHKKSSKERRELECLKVIYPQLFARSKNDDFFAGRLDFLPIGFGCVSSVGGVGHYCVFDKLRSFGSQLPECENRINALYNYWIDNDIKSIYCNQVLDDVHVGRFIDCNYPFLATARMSGLMLNYEMLVELGVNGLKAKILAQPLESEFLKVSLETLDLFVKCLDYLIDELDKSEVKNKMLMMKSLEHLKENKPTTFHQAIQLIWVYALVAGCINYGRMDDILGPFLVNDLEKGIISEEDSLNYLKSLWTLIENRRTTVNGRIIVGGMGRKHPKEADVFAKLALKVTKACKYVEPQFTLRVDKNTSEEVWELALDSIGDKTTYPTIYNDEVNVKSVAFGMNVDLKTASQYVPFGCGEFVIQGQSVGTPNTLLNLLMLLNITINGGYDQGLFKCGNIKFKELDDYQSFEEFFNKYKEVLDFYADMSVKAQYQSYEVMNSEVSFLFSSILMDDCIVRGKSILDGGVKYLGGTNETYGNINTSDSLMVIKQLIFQDKVVKFSELHKAMLNNFVNYPELLHMVKKVGKYGNDIKEVDDLANDLYEYIAKAIRNRGIEKGMQYYLIVISNNQTNTEWGKTTGASADGRLSGTFMNPANNPVGHADKNGPTAMLNSLTRFDAKYHGGSVQNIKFTSKLFNENRQIVNSLIKTYFRKGGCQLMVTVVDKGDLEEAQRNPEKYPNLIVRVSGFSAVFVDLDKDVQDELLSRVLYE